MRGSVRKKGKTWYYSFDINMPGEKRKRIERIGGSTKREAEEKLREAIREFQKDKNMFLQTTVYDLMIMKLEMITKKQHKEQTILNVTQMIRFIKAESTLALSVYDKELTLKIQDFMNQLPNHYTRHTMKKILSLINSSISFGQDYLSLEIPYKKNLVKIKRQNRKENTLLEEQNIIALYKHAPYNYKVLILLLLETGCRIGEALCLSEEDVDFEKNEIKIYKNISLLKNRKEEEGMLLWHSPKTVNSNRVIYITEELKSLLQTYISSSKRIDYYIKTIGENHYLSNEKEGEKKNIIFRTKDGTMLKYDTFLKWKTRFSKKIGIPFKAHDFRKVHATQLLENGLTIKEVSNRLGHSVPSTTLKYYIKSTNEKERTVKVLSQVYSIKKFM